jgi:hypothetical protein
LAYAGCEKPESGYPETTGHTGGISLAPRDISNRTATVNPGQQTAFPQVAVSKRWLLNGVRIRYKKRIMLRSVTILLSLLVVLTVSGCGVWRGAKDVSKPDPSEEGPGVFTGKRGGIVIFQK